MAADRRAYLRRGVRAGAVVALIALPGLAAGPLAAQSNGMQASGMQSNGMQANGVMPIESLHQALHLTGQQEAAWQAYRAEADAPSRAQDRRRAASRMFVTLAAPQRMDLVEAEMREELRDLERQSRALKAFYATLDPAQQRVFDEKTLPPQGGERPRS